MADTRINSLPEEMNPVASEVIALDGATTRKATIQAIVYAGRPAASQAEAEAGSDANKAMTPLTTKQAITAQVSTAGRTGDYNDLSNKPTLGTAAASATTDFATAAQGATADSALQPADVGSAAFEETTAFATAAQGATADAALPAADKASQAEAEAGTENAKYSTPLSVAQSVDGRATKLFGASSLARSIPARFSDTVNLRDWFDRTGSDGTEAANDAAIAALIVYLTANPSVRTLKGNMGDVYRTTAFNQTLPNGVRLMMDGARFRWSGLQGGTTGMFLSMGTGGQVQGMGIDIVAASTFRRFFQTEGDTQIFDSEIISESQINNYGGSLLDWAVRVYRDNNRVRGLKIKNIDKAFFAYGADGDGDPGIDNHLEDIRVESYVTGICLRNLAGARLLNPYVKTKSANATEDPGNNGILHEGVKDYLMANAQVFDSGEHGIRFGGTRNAEQVSVGIVVNGAQIYRSGQTGFKMFTGAVGGTFTNVQVANVQVVDCQYNGPGGNEAPGFNDEGFLLQQIRKGTFAGLSVQRQENTTYSCMDGVYISGSDNLHITGLHIQDPFRNAVRISETDDGGGGASVETLANNEIFIRGFFAENVGQDGVYIAHPTQSVRDIDIEGEMIGSGAATYYAFNGSAGAARFVQPCLFQAKQRNFANGINGLPVTANVKVRDTHGSVY